MANAVVYDQWDDPGMAFSEAQVQEFQPSATAAGRVTWLVTHALVTQRRSDLNTEKPQWWAKVARSMVDCAGWYCVAGQLPGLDRTEVMRAPVREAELKKLSALALRVGEPEEFLEGWRNDLVGVMRSHVTLGRRCLGARQVSGWTVKEKKLSNKVANAVHRELMLVQHLADQLSYLPVRHGEETEGSETGAVS